MDKIKILVLFLIFLLAISVVQAYEPFSILGKFLDFLQSILGGSKTSTTTTRVSIISPTTTTIPICQVSLTLECKPVREGYNISGTTWCNYYPNSYAVVEVYYGTSDGTITSNVSIEDEWIFGPFQCAAGYISPPTFELNSNLRGWYTAISQVYNPIGKNEKACQAVKSVYCKPLIYTTTLPLGPEPTKTTTSGVPTTITYIITTLSSGGGGGRPRTTTSRTTLRATTTTTVYRGCAYPNQHLSDIYVNGYCYYEPEHLKQFCADIIFTNKDENCAALVEASFGDCLSGNCDKYPLIGLPRTLIVEPGKMGHLTVCSDVPGGFPDIEYTQEINLKILNHPQKRSYRSVIEVKGPCGVLAPTPIVPILPQLPPELVKIITLSVLTLILAVTIAYIYMKYIRRKDIFEKAFWKLAKEER